MKKIFLIPLLIIAFSCSKKNNETDKNHVLKANQPRTRHSENTTFPQKLSGYWNSRQTQTSKPHKRFNLHMEGREFSISYGGYSYLGTLDEIKKQGSGYIIKVYINIRQGQCAGPDRINQHWLYRIGVLDKNRIRIYNRSHHNDYKKIGKRIFYRSQNE